MVVCTIDFRSVTFAMKTSIGTFDVASIGTFDVTSVVVTLSFVEILAMLYACCNSGIHPVVIL